MFKIENFLFRREIIHYTGWQNLCRDKSRTARGWQNLCRDKSRTARGWQNLCREESRRRGAGRTSAGKNPDCAGLAESLPGRIQTARGWQNLCREESEQRGAGRTSAGRNQRGFGQTRGLSLHAGANQCGYRADGKSPLGVLSATSQSGKNNLTLYDMLIGIKLVKNVKHIGRKIDHCTVDNLIRYLIISLSNSPGYTGFSIGVAVAKHSYSDCVFKRV